MVKFNAKGVLRAIVSAYHTMGLAIKCIPKENKKKSAFLLLQMLAF
jgi:hypothetical protein